MTQVRSGHADDSVTWETVTACPSCNSSDLRPWRSRCRDSSALVGRPLEYRRCADCACRVLIPRPTADTVGALYGTDYAPYNRRPEDNGILVGASGDRTSLRDALEARYLEGDRGRRVLDFGCGTSDFLDAARAAGWHTVGADFTEAGVNGAASSGHDVKIVDDTFWTWVGEQGFDAIRMNHVIEHLHEPADRLIGLAAGLRSRGFLHVVTPNPDGPTCALFRRTSVFFEPIHLTLIPPATLRHIAERLGATEVEVVPESTQKDLWRSWQLTRRQAPNYAAASGTVDQRWKRKVLGLTARVSSLAGRHDRYHAFITR